MARWKKLGIIAGGGALPGRVAAACASRDEPFFVIRLDGFADEHVADFPGKACGLAEVGKIIRILKEEQCDGVVLTGLVQRPDFTKLRPDWRGAALLPKVISAAASGDGPMLGVFVETLESEGFVVVGAEEVTQDILAESGVFGAVSPGQTNLADIKKAAAVIRAVGVFDIGQAAVVANGHVLAVEAAEGTDKMLERCAKFSDDMRGGEGRHGVLVKRPKPGQELRVDLPTIGVETVRRVGEANLAGIAVEAGKALVMDMPELIREADALGIFVYGFSTSEVRET